jgi:hypothetical protein
MIHRNEPCGYRLLKAEGHGRVDQHPEQAEGEPDDHGPEAAQRIESLPEYPEEKDDEEM